MTNSKKKQLKYYVTTFYKFFDWPSEKSVQEHSLDLENWCKTEGIKGLIIAADEGFNGTVAHSSSLDKFKAHLESLTDNPISFKDSETFGSHPFRRMKVKMREEIVTLGKKEIDPKTTKPGVKHITPSEWNEKLNTDDVQVIDVRNDFEVEMGTFKKAQNLKMQKFTEFPELVKKNDFDKEKPVMMFCTGGIRCEKASLEMAEQGFKEIYQLDGGILKYLEEFPEKEFTGECFVFDHRVSVDQNLNPSKDYALCVHCGQPGKKNVFNCIQCGESCDSVCEKCFESERKKQTCSKNCEHHFKLGHKSRKQILTKEKSA